MLANDYEKTMDVQSYRDLVVWQEGMGIVSQVYKATRAYPKQEVYGLVSQMRRCSVSIPSNIAEGHARTSTLDYLRHLSIAMGSLAELETQLILSGELGYLEEISLNRILTQTDRLGKRMRALKKSLRAKVDRHQ